MNEFNNLGKKCQLDVDSIIRTGRIIAIMKDSIIVESNPAYTETKTEFSYFIESEDNRVWRKHKDVEFI